MPLKGTYTGAPAPTPAAEEPSWFQKIGGLPGVGATGLRALSGVLAAEGGLPGAAIAGLGEAGAEGLEWLGGGDSPSLKRIGVEAGLGAVPFGATFKAGRPIASALRGAAFSGAGEAAREALGRGEDLNPKSIAMSAGTGGLVSGGLAKLLGGSAPAVPKPEVHDVQTFSSRQPTLKPRYAVEGELPAPPRARVSKQVPGYGMPEEAVAPAVSQQGEMPPTPIQTSRIPYRAPDEMPTTSLRDEVADQARQLREQRMEQKMLGQAMKYNETRQAARAAEAEDAVTRGRIAEEMSGMERGPATATEVLKAEGEPTVRIPYRVPEIDEERVVGAAPKPPVQPTSYAPQAETIPAHGSMRLGELTDKASAGTITAAELAEAQQLTRELSPNIVPKPEAPPVTPATPTEPLGQLMRVGPSGEKLPSRGDVAGEHYRDMQTLLKTGQASPTEQQGARVAGRALAREGKAPGVPPAAAEVRTPPAGPEAPAPSTPATTDWVREQSDIAEAAAEMDPQTRQNFLQRLGQEKGAAGIGAIGHLGMGALGALIGGATDPLGNPMASAVAGGVAGVASPFVLERLRNLQVPSASFPDIHASLSSGNIKDAAKRVYETLPQIQRFNYLADATGLPANAVAGPYGSAVMGALEHALSGDQRGWQALETLKNPVDFFNRFRRSFGEAGQLIGRAEGDPTAGASLPRKILGAPGMYMTAGDVAARDILEEAGFSAAEARKLTLTSEPEMTLPRHIASFTRGSPLAQMLFPFTRTPANILEQGSMRLPGVGSIIQANREVPDPLRQQMVQQGLGAAVGAGSAAVGSALDPEDERVVGRYMTNMAGTYGLPASLGLAAGQAMWKGKSPISGAITEMGRAFPLPTTESITDLLKLLSGEGGLPRGMVPSVLRKADLVPTGGAGDLGPLPSVKRLRVE